MDHVSIDAAAGGVVQHDVTTGPDELVHTAIDVRIARGLIVAGAAGVQCRDTGPCVVASMDVLGDLFRLRGQMGILALARHATGRGNGNDHFVIAHRASPRSRPCRLAPAVDARAAGVIWVMLLYRISYSYF